MLSFLLTFFSVCFINLINCIFMIVGKTVSIGTNLGGFPGHCFSFQSQHLLPFKIPCIKILNFFSCRSLSPLLNNHRMDRNMRILVRETLPEFTSRDKGNQSICNTLKTMPIAGSCMANRLVYSLQFSMGVPGPFHMFDLFYVQNS